jgi:hypothetical protein
MRYLIPLILAFLCSCGAITDYAKEAAKEEVAKQFSERMPAEVIIEADTDQSGDVSWDEWYAWLKGGGVAGLAGLAWIFAKKYFGMKKQVAGATAAPPE